jgi:hypothetical protein
VPAHIEDRRSVVGAADYARGGALCEFDAVPPRRCFDAGRECAREVRVAGQHFVLRLEEPKRVDPRVMLRDLVHNRRDDLSRDWHSNLTRSVKWQ